MSYRCNSSSPFVKVSKKCQKSVTKDFEIFPSGNGSVRLAVTMSTQSKLVTHNNLSKIKNKILPICLQGNFKRYHIFSCIRRFVYKSTPVFQAKNNDIFESSCIS